PTTVSARAGCPNTAAAIGPITSRTDRTTSCGAATASGWSTTRAAAPASTACCANAWPSTCSPGMQKNSDPAGTSRESCEASRTVSSGSPRTSAPTTAATSASRTGGKVGSTARDSGSGQPVRGKRHGRARLDPEPLDRVARDVLEQRCRRYPAVDRVGFVQDRGDHHARTRRGQEPDEGRDVPVDVVTRAVDLLRGPGLARNLVARDLGVVAGPVLNGVGQHLGELLAGRTRQ